ncbi:MAG TPA: GNAT family N-acetyltransferase, partial [Balneolales bacterium]|nr:GNAT family N-acetyltransferase [Balneolales bacterium]
IFNDERVYDFYKSISQLFQKKGIAQLQAVSIPGPKGQYIVIDLFLKFGRTIYSLQTSFDDSSPYSKYSPGHISLFSIIKNAIDNGMKYLNLERGQESYKSRVANNTIQNRNINIRHSSHSNTRRLILYRMLYWVFWKKYKLNYEWKILMIFCHEYHLLPGLNKYIYDLFYRISNKLSNQN